ncbi:MAG: hypothetical protein JWQ14_2300, partial [Adhaeribacter sp.]|nr:hypothetical protein [Adhaeribacter sp.]
MVKTRNNSSINYLGNIYAKVLINKAAVAVTYILGADRKRLCFMLHIRSRSVQKSFRTNALMHHNIDYPIILAKYFLNIFSLQEVKTSRNIKIYAYGSDTFFKFEFLFTFLFKNYPI